VSNSFIEIFLEHGVGEGDREEKNDIYNPYVPYDSDAIEPAEMIIDESKDVFEVGFHYFFIVTREKSRKFARSSSEGVEEMIVISISELSARERRISRFLIR
jgi:hypothetical protein